MTEADWLKAKDPESMLRLIGGRLSPRQWHLLASAVVRRAWDILPAGPLRESIEWAEQNPNATSNHPELKERLPQLEPAARAAADLERDEQRRILIAADPDADPESFRHEDTRKTNPSAPLFQAACRAAGIAVQQAGDSVQHLADAVTALLELQPGTAQLAAIREQVVNATRVRAEASLSASTALKLKALGDEMADVDNGQNVRLRYSRALHMVNKEEEQARFKHSDLPTQKERADKKALGRLLQDLVGNPFQKHRFELAWRTTTVMGLAKTIYQERAYDRFPILADALLDADCDEEAILRHCRGTETHAPDGPIHARGCWVLDLILEHEPAFYSTAPIAPPAPPARAPKSRPRGNNGLASLLESLRTGAPPADLDESDE